MQEEQPLVLVSRAGSNTLVDETKRHLQLLTETIEAVNSTLDLEEVLALVARKVADALGADACFVYLYDERSAELVLRATHGTRVEEMTKRPRLPLGEGITGVAAEERLPVMLPADAHLDPRFKSFPNLPEDRFQSILAVPILARDKLEGALNVRTIEPREFTRGEIDLLLAIAAQVAQSIQHARLYAATQRRVVELEALARISEAVSDSLYLEESLAAIVRTTMDALGATGRGARARRRRDRVARGPRRRVRRAAAAALARTADRRARLRPRHAVLRRRPAAARRRSRTTRRSRSSTVAPCMRGVLAQEIHHRVKNNLQTVASLLRLQARATDGVDPREALEHSVNRILAIAAVHEVLTERRDDDVLLDDLLDRLRAMLVQGIGAGKHVESALEPIALAGVARDGAGARLQRAAAERARARRRGRAHRARAAERRRRPRDRRFGRRARGTARTEPASRSCARSSATS